MAKQRENLASPVANVVELPKYDPIFVLMLECENVVRPDGIGTTNRFLTRNHNEYWWPGASVHPGRTLRAGYHALVTTETTDKIRDLVRVELEHAILWPFLEQLKQKTDANNQLC